MKQTATFSSTFDSRKWRAMTFENTGSKLSEGSKNGYSLKRKEFGDSKRSSMGSFVLKRPVRK